LQNGLRLHNASSPADFACLRQSKCFQRRDNVSDAEEFEKTIRAMSIIGFEEKEKVMISLHSIKQI
jgi:myosin heavy subunit